MIEILSKDVDKLRDQCDFLNKEREKLFDENKRLKQQVREFKDEVAILKELLVNSKADIKILKSDLADYKANEMTALSNHHIFGSALKDLEAARNGLKRSGKQSIVSARDSGDQAELSGYINYENRSRSQKPDSNRNRDQPYMPLGLKPNSINNSRLVVADHNLVQKREHH